MNKFFKKLAVLLSFVLVFSAMPMSVFAATPVTTFDELKNAVAAGGEVVLGADIGVDGDWDSTKTITVTSDVTLDLNGYTLYGPHINGSEKHFYAFSVSSGAKLTLIDSSAGQTGKIKCHYSGIQTKGGTFVMNGGKIIAADANMAVAIVNYGGSVVINGGSVEAYHWGILTQGYWTTTATTEINGGSVSLKPASNIDETQYGDTILIGVGGSNNTGAGAGANSGSATVKINGGNLDSNGEEPVTYDNSTGTATAEISGGTFTTAPAEEYIAPGKVFDPATGTVVTAAAGEAAPATGEHVWGYNPQYDAAAHWDYCHVCGAQNTPVAHSDANGDGVCDCGWVLANTPSRVNPNTGVTADMLK